MLDDHASFICTKANSYSEYFYPKQTPHSNHPHLWNKGSFPQWPNFEKVHSKITWSLPYFPCRWIACYVHLSCLASFISLVGISKYDLLKGDLAEPQFYFAIFLVLSYFWFSWSLLSSVNCGMQSACHWISLMWWDRRVQVVEPPESWLSPSKGRMSGTLWSVSKESKHSWSLGIVISRF